jgi:uncharacterized membrane protein
MINAALFYSIILALTFGFCPLIARLSGLTPGWTSAFLALGTLPIVVCGFWYGGAVPAGRSLIIGLLAGVINGVGLMAYGKLTSGQFEISRFMPIALAIAPAIIAVGGWIFFHEPISLNKIIGIIAVVVAVWLLH